MNPKIVNLTKLASLSGAALLVGCASTPPLPAEVKVPTSVRCLTAAPARPTYEFERLPVAASDGEKVLALARDWVRSRKYEAAIEAALAGCLPATSVPP